MRILGVGVGSPTAADRQALLASARLAALTYDWVGVTLEAAGVERLGGLVLDADLGRGADVFRRAREALRSWGPQRSLGADVTPLDQAVELGATVVLVVQRGPVHVVVPNRVVAVIDEPTRFAYAYGSLPGHPERGEESFTVELLDDDTVRATVRVVATVPTALARPAGPVISLVSRAAAHRYLRSLQSACAGSRNRGRRRGARHRGSRWSPRR